MASSPRSKRLPRLRAVLHSVIMMALGAVAAFIVVGVVILDAKPDLSIWHRADLDEEFNAGSPVHTLTDYLALEERLFRELKDEVYDLIAPVEQTQVNRYHTGSLSDPGRWRRNWNRTFELTSAEPRFAALLLHGYSDSPYSLRSLGLTLNAEGGHILGLRLPGHGTAPSGLKFTSWQDMAATVRLAVVDLARRFPGKPIFVAGYSNGAALAVQYALETLAHDGLPRPSGLILISPQIGVTPAAALAGWQSLFGHTLGLDKLTWNSVQPEYDPFKYNSFAVNAAVQAHRITGHIQKRMVQLDAKDLLGKMPPVLAFQSAVDATVTARALVTGLFDRLKPGDHRLVVFDINRVFEAEGLVRRPPVLDGLFTGPARHYDVALVTNRNKTTTAVALRERPAGGDTVEEQDLGMNWPAQVYSLSHIALPFPPDDPAYGSNALGENPGLKLGLLALRGEVRITEVPASAMARLHWNPFHSVLIDQVKRFVSVQGGVVGK